MYLYIVSFVVILCNWVCNNWVYQFPKSAWGPNQFSGFGMGQGGASRAGPAGDARKASATIVHRTQQQKTKDPLDSCARWHVCRAKLHLKQKMARRPPDYSSNLCLPKT